MFVIKKYTRFCASFPWTVMLLKNISLIDERIFSDVYCDVKIEEIGILLHLSWCVGHFLFISKTWYYTFRGLFQAIRSLLKGQIFMDDIVQHVYITVVIFLFKLSNYFSLFKKRWKWIIPSFLKQHFFFLVSIGGFFFSFKKMLGNIWQNLGLVIKIQNYKLY